MAACSQTNIPVLNQVTAPCNGVTTPTTCIIHEPSITYLGLTVDSTLLEVINALVAELQAQDSRITALETEVGLQSSAIATLQADLIACCAP
jgi:hypothetical protein